MHNPVPSALLNSSAEQAIYAQAFGRRLAANDHNWMPGLQGGAANEYYHMTAAEYAAKGTVTSITVTGANGIGVSGSPITSSGTIGLSLGAITPTSITVTKPSVTVDAGVIEVLTNGGRNLVLLGTDPFEERRGQITIYGTDDGAGNYERLRIYHVGDNNDYATFVSEKGGTGTIRDIYFQCPNIRTSGSLVISNGRITVDGGAGAQSVIHYNETNVGEKGTLGYAAGAYDLIYRIGGSAIDQGTEGFRVTQAGSLNIGTTGTTVGNSNRLQVAGTTAATNSLGISAWSTDALGSRIELGKSRGAAIGTNTIVQNNDVVASVTGYGANGSTFTNLASISMEVDGTPGATNDMPGRVVISTVPDGSGTLTEAMRLSQDQSALFANTIKTAAPTTGTAAPWKLGTLVTGQVGLVMLSTQYLEVDVNGSLVKLATI